MLVAPFDLRATHRQRVAPRLHSAESGPLLLGRLEQVEVDVDGEDTLHAADVRVAELLVRVEERTGPLDARSRVDDLVAVDPAAPALGLVLGTKRKLSCRLR